MIVLQIFKLQNNFIKTQYLKLIILSHFELFQEHAVFHFNLFDGYVFMKSQNQQIIA